MWPRACFVKGGLPTFVALPPRDCGAAGAQLSVKMFTQTEADMGKHRAALGPLQAPEPGSRATRATRPPLGHAARGLRGSRQDHCGETDTNPQREEPPEDECLGTSEGDLSRGFLVPPRSFKPEGPSGLGGLCALNTAPGAAPESGRGA